MAIRERGLGVLVERLQVRARRCRIEIVVELLHVLAVVSLRAGQPEEALLQDRVASVPQRQREAEPALAVGDPQQPVLAPAVGPAARVIVRQIVPDGSVRRVVLAHGPPLALGEVRSPPLPVADAAGVLIETAPLGVGIGTLAVAHAASGPREGAGAPQPAWPATESRRSRSKAALMSARWVKAWGKF